MFFGIHFANITSCSIPRRSDLEAVKLNAPYLLTDYSSGIPKDIIDQIDFLVVLNHNASDAALVKDGVPIIMPYDLSCTVPGYDTPKILKDQYDKTIASLKGRRGFIPVMGYESDGIEDRIKAEGMTLKQIIPVSVNFFAKPAPYFLYEVEFK